MSTNIILRFAEYMFGKWDLEVVNKKDSWLMNFIGWFLQLIKVMTKETFMENYTTTMFGKVYLNFELGNLEQRSGISQMALITHESEHRRQCIRDSSWLWRLGYLFSEKRRTCYEMVAYGSTMKIKYTIGKEMPDIEKYINKLKPYRCNKYLDMARDYFEFVVANLNNDTYDTEIEIDAKQWIKNEMLPHTRRSC